MTCVSVVKHLRRRLRVRQQRGRPQRTTQSRRREVSEAYHVQLAGSCGVSDLSVEVALLQLEVAFRFASDVRGRCDCETALRPAVVLLA